MRAIEVGSVDQSTRVRIFASNGIPKTDVVAASAGLAFYVCRPGAAPVAITPLSDLAALTSPHADGGLKHERAGYYRLDVPDAAFADGASEVMITGEGTGLVVVGGYHQLIADPVGALLGATAADYNEAGTIGAAINSGGEVSVNLVQAAATLPSPYEASTITMYRGDSQDVTLIDLGSIPPSRTKLWFTVKRDLERDEDSAAIFQIEETAGLLYFQGAVLGGDTYPSLNSASAGIAITDETTGVLVISRTAALSALQETHQNLSYDIKYLAADGDTKLLAQGKLRVRATATRAVS